MTQTVKPSLAQSPIHRTVLDNGIVLLVAENPAADIIAGRIFIRAGSCYEKREQAGLAHLLAALMTKGCEGLSSLEIAEQVESVGASLSADTSTDYFLVSLKTVTSDFPEILALAGRILRSPTFPETQIELERRLALQDIRSQKEQPFTLAFEQMRQVMYQNHPYAMSVLGDETTLNSITRADLVEYHQTYFRPDNLVISVAGRITLQEVVALVEQVFGDWQTPSVAPAVVNLPKISVNPQHRLKPVQTQQSIVMLGYLGPSVSSPDYASLKLLSTYLGNGLSSRLFVELREKRGLAYEVSAFYPTRLYPASFVVYMGTAPENTSIALEGLRTEVELLCSKEVSTTNLQAAKNKILGQYALGKQTNGQIAQIYGWYEILGLGIDFDREFQELIAAVTAQDALTSAQQYLQQPYVSLVGQEEAINRAIN
ncbi:Peptidase M16-like protein [Trichormus variabilis ATCC 29413]|uniref:Peptidase M16-like protein n=2 Tax=Anabaena variabilis TaxID=264691 RepID=Q3M527_TRIV2|nr:MULTISPECIES: pitrilysin family protein [Nostocaceae]ABA23909.1 Peptidase M16-like protein [Trichormus variabilis ATCC 29413]MBC1215641.1 insulinase family protein [Trichormus variabilis ARAD]MBC1257400.1 insulinase family protein [Trichormus variabilis V5]MBC1266723.1 insulinase family protein [Trichormus variabilis FSR]MBC1300482.1 insulinase family protein [Trichormus variabilis N2B]